MNKRINKYAITILIFYGSLGVLSGQEHNDSIDTYIEGLPDSIKIDFLYNKALSYQYTSLSKALHYADWRLKIANQQNRPDIYASTYNLYGNLYLESGLYPNAEKYYRMAYDIYQELGSYEGLATECHNLGLVLFFEGDTINSLNYYQESVFVRKKSGNQKRIGDGLTTLGEVYLSINKPRESIEFLYEALEYYGDTTGYPRKMDCMIFLSDILIKESPVKAKEWLILLEENNKVLKSYKYEQVINLKYASYYLATGIIDKCISLVDSLDIESLISYEFVDPLAIYLQLSEYLFDTGNVQLGIKYSRAARQIHEKQQYLLTTSRTSEFKTRLNLRIADEELKVLNELNLISLQQIRIDGIIKTIIILAVCLISVIGLSFMINVLYLIHDNRKLKNNKTEMEEAHNRLLRYQESILKTRENKNIFFTMISGKLNQPFKELTIELENLGEMSSMKIVRERFINKLKDILAIGINIEKGLKRVLLWSKLQRNRYEVQKSIFSVNDFLHELLPDILGTTVKKDIRVRFDVDQGLTINYDKHSLKTILRILIENGVDNSERKSDIIIRGHEARTGSIISITDFGKGIPSWLQTTIFDINRHSANPGESSKLGLGLLIAKHMAEINSSYISFESNQKKGSTFFIHIPDNNG